MNKFAHKMVTSKEAWAEVQAMRENDKRMSFFVNNVFITKENVGQKEVFKFHR